MAKEKTKKLVYGTIIADFNNDYYIFLKRKDNKTAYVLKFNKGKISELTEISLNSINRKSSIPDNLNI